MMLTFKGWHSWVAEQPRAWGTHPNPNPNCGRTPTRALALALTHEPHFQPETLTRNGAGHSFGGSSAVALWCGPPSHVPQGTPVPHTAAPDVPPSPYAEALSARVPIRVRPDLSCRYPLACSCMLCDQLCVEVSLAHGALNHFIFEG